MAWGPILHEKEETICILVSFLILSFVITETLLLTRCLMLLPPSLPATMGYILKPLPNSTSLSSSFCPAFCHSSENILLLGYTLPSLLISSDCDWLKQCGTHGDRRHCLGYEAVRTNLTHTVWNESQVTKRTHVSLQIQTKLT